MFDLVRADWRKCCRIHLGTERPSRLRAAKLFAGHFGFHCVLVYRFGAWATAQVRARRWLGAPFLIAYLAANHAVRLVHHVNLRREAVIGPGFYISHVGTIFVDKITADENLSLTHNVTIGVGHARGGAGVPRRIGRNVWIGTGSVIAGDLTIGDDVTILPCSVVTRTLPDRVLVGGNPAKLVLKDYDNRELFGPTGDEV
ncbi:MAG: serine acetyltransferase [Candidatus Krumholzibacteriia bacterium]